MSTWPLVSYADVIVIVIVVVVCCAFVIVSLLSLVSIVSGAGGCQRGHGGVIVIVSVFVHGLLFVCILC
jgi:hypothetical protein